MECEQVGYSKLKYSLNVFAKAVHLFSLVLPVRNKSEIKIFETIDLRFLQT